ncbi:ABC transporter permease [Alkaliphilus peptidifermentans]|uniref:Peptide/nickel transport system permease protein n=1 Tax=Alkaliphilus peptidifermentans DSM 18978 TaxID=1120976 RepID=A0A1G5BIS1_9FIRM|nr:ABC transporter permease [Alkaliphilus peptidifermentans]SCX90055.1 peptide/nickel transport system permease protein [Alkaliphilus peptidifermentans DSM 18978]
MLRYLARRILHMIPVMIIISICIFTIIKLTPGSPVGLNLDPEMTAEQRQAEYERLGLHLPLPVQYVNWVGRSLNGDFGPSSLYNRPVSEIVPKYVWNSFKLNVLVFIFAFLLSVPIGIICAVKQYSFTDNFWTVFSLFGISMPSFFFGLLLIYFFAAKLGWFPISGMMTAGSNLTGMANVLDQLRHMILPATVLTIGSLASLVRYTRTSMLDIIKQDYIRTARSKGLTEKVVIYRHAFRNAMLPIVTLIGFWVPQLFSGAVILETVFNWPGIGQIMLNAINFRDYNLMMATLLLFAVLTLLGNLLADIGYAVVDPRIKVE